MTIVKCNVCFQKKSQRNCPALQQLICPTCCGEHKEKVQDCPKDCIFLIESELFKDEKYYEEMKAKTDRVKRDIINGEERYTNLVEGLEDVVYKRVSQDENFEDEHVFSAISEMTDNFMSRKMKIVEDADDIQLNLNRVGTLKSEVMVYLNGLLADKDKEFENYEIAGCLDMFKLMVLSQKAPAAAEEGTAQEGTSEVDKRLFIKSLIEAKIAKEEETTGETGTDAPSEIVEAKESKPDSAKSKEKK